MEEGQEQAVEQEETEAVDPWEAAEQEYDAPSGTVAPEAVKEEVNQPEKVAEDGTKRDPFNFENVKIPHKYRDHVKAHFEPVLKEKEAALESVTQEREQAKEAVTEALGVLKEIVSDPARAAFYVQTYGEQIGLSPEVMAKYRQAPEAEAKSEEPKLPSYDEISQKYQARLLTTTDPKEFVSLLDQRDSEMREASKGDMLNMMGQLLVMYHEKEIKPDKQTLTEFKTKAEKDAEIATFQATKSSWVTAKTDIISKYADFKTYEPKIIKLIKEDPQFELVRQHLNKNKDDVEGRTKLIEKAYHLVSMQDRVAPQRPRTSGLPPSSKFLNTKKSGGGDWDDPIHDEIWNT
jgi:hypothetical protein